MECKKRAFESKKDIDRWFKELENQGIQTKHILPHDSYLINLGHPEVEAREKIA